MADTEANNPVIREILRQGRKLPKKVRSRYIAAALETGRIESGFKNVGYGDADSVNWRQERASIYGGDMSIRRSVKRFYKEAAQQDRGQASYELAADVQRPAAQYRGRYKNAQGEALGLLKGSGVAAAPGPMPQPQMQTVQTSPGVDNSLLRRQLVGQFLQTGGVANPNAVLALAAGYGQARDVAPTYAQQQVSPSTAGSGSGSRSSSKVRMPKGTANFEGHKVAAWIKPALVYARKNGWKGQVNSGYRSYEDQTRIYNSGVRPAAKPGTSNHEGADYPRGAVDVSDPETLSRILARSPYAKKLKWAGSKDPVHFSHPHNGSY